VARVVEFEGEGGLILHRPGRYGLRPWRADDYYKLIFITDGTYSVETPGGLSTIASGQFIVLNAGAVHRHRHLSGAKLLVEITPDLFESTVRSLGVADGMGNRPILCGLPSASRALTMWATSAVEELREPRLGDGLLLEQSIHALAVHLLRLELQGPDRSCGVPAVDRALERMHTTYDAPLSLADLARAANMERFSFAHSFKRSVGLSPQRYLLRLRLQRASTLLRGTDESVLSIALRCGFGSLSSFNRAFRRGFDRSPRAYREMCTLPRLPR
jgi:AraC family transcriptional regulator